MISRNPQSLWITHIHAIAYSLVNVNATLAGDTATNGAAALIIQCFSCLISFVVCHINT